MRPSALIYLYVRRLRSHAAQELLAGVGIAVAVALVLAAIVTETSIASSAASVVRTVVGPANLQLRARGGEGMRESLVGQVKRLPAVAQAAPLLEDSATLRAGDGRSVRVQLAGTDLRLAVLDGLAQTLPVGALSSSGIGLSRASAQALHISSGGRPRFLTLQLRGRARRLRVTAVLGPEAAGALSDAYVAVMPLARMQQLAGQRGTVSRIFVRSRHEQRALAAGELSRLSGAHLEVAPANADVRTLRQALGPSGLASGLFAAIGALLGFLLAFNAMLLTVAARRRAIADLRVAGARRASVIELVLFQALCLGIPASALGVLAGSLLSTGVFHQSTGYLSEAFTLSAGTILAPWQAALAFAGGVLATCAASCLPLLDLRRGRARDAIYASGGVPGQALGRASRSRLALGSLCLLTLASVLWVTLPSAAIAATALLAIATVLAVPLAFAAVLSAAEALGRRLHRLSILPLALASLRATTVRSLALAATGAVALFGSVALGGARDDLLRGIHSFAHSYVSDTSVWVTNPGDNQAVDPFAPPPHLTQRLARIPGVARVTAFHGGFIQLHGRRVWLIARPPSAERRVLDSEIDAGGAARALRALARGGAIVVSSQIAAERGLRVGQPLLLRTPDGGASFKIAATSTNLAWPPGVIFMSAADYARYWGRTDPTALGVTLRPGASAAAVRAAAASTLRRGSGLEVSVSSTRAQRIDALAGEGLGQLGEVSSMLLIAAIVAMAAALASSVWQRRPGLASLRLLGARRSSLQAILAIEASLMLLAGCLTGAIAGVYGQVVIDAFLRHVTGFPLASPTTSARPLALLAIALAAGLAAGTLPSWLAARVRPILALGSD